MAKAAKRTKTPTIIDVAEASGVSKSTVANVVNGAPHLSDQTRERVLDAIRRLGYRPNALARDLKRQRTATVGVIVGDLTNPFYAELTKLIERRLGEAGYATIICDTDGDRKTERSKIDILLQQRVSGIAMLHYSGATKPIEEVEAHGVPVVGISVVARAFPSVASDDVMGARIAVSHLAELGHSRIAYVIGNGTEGSTNAARFRGVKQGAAKAGLPSVSKISLTPATEDDQNASAADAAREADAPTAYVVGNDLTALDLIDRLEREGVSVPRDVSVVGFDDIAPARLRRLSLTTIHQPINALAEHGVAQLLAQIGNKGSEQTEKRREKLSVELVVRGSTGPPRR